MLPDSRTFANRIKQSFSQHHEKDLSNIKLVNPLYENTDKTYLENILSYTNKVINFVAGLEQVPNYRLIHDKYMTELIRLHYIVYSLVDIYKNGINEYHAYRDLLNNLKAIKFNLFAASNLFNNINHYIQSDGLQETYDLIDKLNELNKENESLFLGEDSSIIVEA